MKSAPPPFPRTPTRRRSRALSRLAPLLFLFAAANESCVPTDQNSINAPTSPLVAFAAYGDLLKHEKTRPTIIKNENGKDYIRLQAKDKVIWAELAITEKARRLGLMRRKHLEKNHGMLFVFPQDCRPSMWMKNTYIPLSCAFIRSDGLIMQVVRMKPQTLKLHSSLWSVRFALEMNADWFDRNNVHAGDRIEIPSFLLKSPNAPK